MSWRNLCSFERFNYCSSREHAANKWRRFTVQNINKPHFIDRSDKTPE